MQAERIIIIQIWNKNNFASWKLRKMKYVILGSPSIKLWMQKCQGTGKSLFHLFCKGLGVLSRSDPLGHVPNYYKMFNISMKILPQLLCKKFGTNKHHHVSRLLCYITKCSAEGQILHCKCWNLGWSSAEGRSSTINSVTKVAVLPGTEQVQ